MKIVGKRWKALSPKEKEEFNNKAEEDKKRYNREIMEFNKDLNKVKIKTADEKKLKSSGKLSN